MKYYYHKALGLRAYPRLLTSSTILGRPHSEWEILVPPNGGEWELVSQEDFGHSDYYPNYHGLGDLRKDHRYRTHCWFKPKKKNNMTSLPKEVTVKLDKQTQEQLDQILSHLADLNSAANPKLARKAGGFLFSALKSRLMWAATLALLGYLGITGKVSDWQLPELYPVIREVVEYNAETGEITIDNRGVLEHIIFDDGKFFSNSGSPVEDSYYDQLKKSLNNVTDKFEFPKQRSIWR